MRTRPAGRAFVVRNLEWFVKAGLTPAEALATATTTGAECWVMKGGQVMTRTPTVRRP